MRKSLVTMIILGVVVVGLLGVFAPLFRQEGNPLPFISAAARLAANHTQIEPLSPLAGRYLIRSGDGIAPVVQLLESQGWQYQEQMGAGIIFYKDGVIMTALSRMYSRLYMVISIPSLDQPPLEATSTSITLTATGDILMHNTVIAAGLQNGNYDFNNLFAPVKHWIEAGDYASVNLECALAGSAAGYTGYPLFNSPDSIADTLKNTGFDLVVTANNHILDRGFTGAMRTMDVLRQAGLDTAGTYKTPEEKQQFLIKDIRGVKVGYVAYSYSTNGIPVPQDKPFFYNFLDRERIIADIHALRPQVDVLVLVLHWGVEYSPLPTAEQRALAREFFSEGADVILGSHPHVIQPLEIMQIDDKQKFVIYSMGNSMGNQNGVERNSGVILSLQFTKDRLSGATSLSGFSYIPTYIQPYYANGRRLFRVIPIEETIQAIKAGEDPYLDADSIPMLEQIWAATDQQLTRPLP